MKAPFVKSGHMQPPRMVSYCLQGRVCPPHPGMGPAAGTSHVGSTLLPPTRSGPHQPPLQLVVLPAASERAPNLPSRPPSSLQPLPGLPILAGPLQILSFLNVTFPEDFSLTLLIYALKPWRSDDLGFHPRPPRAVTYGLMKLEPIRKTGPWGPQASRGQASPVSIPGPLTAPFEASHSLGAREIRLALTP